MIIHNIKIENFKSLYGVHSFDFDKCKRKYIIKNTI